jgi:histone deacetylase complex subunit SAP18
MSLQPAAKSPIDRQTHSPFLLRLFFRLNNPYTPSDFAIAPPADTEGINDYTSLLPASIRQNSIQIYTWSTCSLSELTGLLLGVLPEGILGDTSAGTRLVYKLVFPDTRGAVSESGKGRWIDRPLGSVVIGEGFGRNEEAVDDGDEAMANGDTSSVKNHLTGDAEKTLADARFVIGDYVACTIYPPGPDGRPAPLPPPPGRGSRDPYVAPRGGPPSRENGYGPPRGGSYRGSYGGRGGGAPPMSDWRRGERPPAPGSYGGGGYRGGRGRPY